MGQPMPLDGFEVCFPVINRVTKSEPVEACVRCSGFARILDFEVESTWAA